MQKDCFEVYALVPGLLREEVCLLFLSVVICIYIKIHIILSGIQVHVQSDPGGRLVISGEPEHLDNPWGVTPFKKVKMNSIITF